MWNISCREACQTGNNTCNIPLKEPQSSPFNIKLNYVKWNGGKKLNYIKNTNNTENCLYIFPVIDNCTSFVVTSNILSVDSILRLKSPYVPT